MKTFRFLTLAVIALLAGGFLQSCSDDDPGNGDGGGSSASSETYKAINATFGGSRLDSISSHENYDNIKITYSNGLLISYKECYDNGNIHDGVNFNLSWTRDTVFLTCGQSLYRAAIGANGCVEKLICPNGKVNSYTYDDNGYLIKYHYGIVEGSAFIELTWQDSNVIQARSNYDDNDDDKYVDYFYSYNSEPNPAGLLPPLGCVYQWITDAGRPVGYGVNTVLYYAGILGKGTKNLPSASYNRYYNGQSNQKYNFIYQLDGSGYVESASDGFNTDHYFYTK